MDFDDAWAVPAEKLENSGASSSDPDEALLTNMPNLNQTGGQNQDMLVSEEKSTATIPPELDSIPDKPWENDTLSEVEADEDWTGSTITAFDDLNIFENLDLFDIDVALSKQEETLQLQNHKRGRGASTWRQRLERWGGGVHVNWANKETAEWKVLVRLGYTSVPLSKETRDYIIQAAHNAKLSYREKVRFTKQLTNARDQLALLPSHNEEELEDPYAARREALQAEIAEIEQTLARKMQWMTIKKAVQFLGQDIEFDDLMTRDNYLIRW